MDGNLDARPADVQAETELPLYRRFPELASRAPRLPLARLPTPVERLPGVRVEAWIKRDDLTGELYGGNKVRKLEFLLAAARLADAERLITIGAIGSHHALATTVYGVAAGFRVTAVLLPQAPTDHVRAVLRAMAAHGAELRIVGGPARVPAAIAAARFAHRRERVRVIPAGGSDAVGTLGYVNAGLEFAAQCARGDCPVPLEAHVAGGTLGTAVGLTIGFALAGLPTRVIAHRITSRVITNDRRARRLARETLALLVDSAAVTPSGLPRPSDVLARLHIHHRQIGRGYGFETPGAIAALDRFHAHGWPELDLTYTGKAAAGFLQATHDASSGPMLYWHTLSPTEPPPPAAFDPSRLSARIRRFL